MKLSLCGETLELLPERALLWPSHHTLVVADIHLGKAATFRSFGIPVPEGCMQEDLNRLGALIDKYRIQKCIVAGDLIHAKRGLTSHTLNLFADWLSSIPAEVHLVLGNHDKALEKVLPERWKIECHSKLIFPPFVFKHLPEKDVEGFVWAGHLHPLAQVKYGGKVHKLPTFQIGAAVGVLPAFSSFVKGAVVENDTLYPIAGDYIFKL